MFVVSFLYLLSRWIMFVYFENSFQRADKASALTPKMADRVSSRRKRKTVQFRGMLVWIIIFYF